MAALPPHPLNWYRRHFPNAYSTLPPTGRIVVDSTGCISPSQTGLRALGYMYCYKGFICADSSPSGSSRHRIHQYYS